MRFLSFCELLLFSRSGRVGREHCSHVCNHLFTVHCSFFETERVRERVSPAGGSGRVAPPDSRYSGRTQGTHHTSALHLYPKATGVCTSWVGGLVHTLVAFGSLCHAEAGYATSVVHRVLQRRVQTLAVVVSEVAFMCPKKELRSIQSCQA